MPTNPTNATDAVQRVRDAVAREDKLNAKLSIPAGCEDEFVSATAEVRWADLRALLARVETLEAEREALRTAAPPRLRSTRLLDAMLNIADPNEWVVIPVEDYEAWSKLHRMLHAARGQEG